MGKRDERKAGFGRGRKGGGRLRWVGKGGRESKEDLIGLYPFGGPVYWIPASHRPLSPLLYFSRLAKGGKEGGGLRRKGRKCVVVGNKRTGDKGKAGRESEG